VSKVSSQKVKTERFLKELGELSKKYGMTIGGCHSCCGAPWVVTQKGRDVTYLVEYLMFCKSCGAYGSQEEHEEH